MPNQSLDLDPAAFAERLKEAMTECGIPAGHGAGAWLARRFKTSKYTGNAWLNGSHKPKPETAQEMATMLSVQFEWLYTGNGRKRAERGILDAPDEYKSVPAALTDAELDLLRHYRAADESLRHMVDAVLHANAKPKGRK